VKGRMVALKVIKKTLRCLAVRTAASHEHFDIGRRLIRMDGRPVQNQQKYTDKEAPKCFTPRLTMGSAQCVSSRRRTGPRI
jgi:hypothetical protein